MEVVVGGVVEELSPPHPHRTLSVRSVGSRKEEEQSQGPSQPPGQDVVRSKQLLEESPLR